LLQKDFVSNTLKDAGFDDDTKNLLKNNFIEIAKQYYTNVFQDDNNNEAIKNYAEFKYKQLDNLNNVILYSEDHPYSVLSSLSDKIHIPESPDAVDSRSTEAVFNTLLGKNKETSFDICKTANIYTTLSALDQLFTENISQPNDDALNEITDTSIDSRTGIYDKLTELSGQLQSLKQAVKNPDRLAQLKAVFDDEKALDSFVNGPNGIDALMAEAEGRRSALLNGWPPSDLELIGSFYQKRAMIEKILSNTPYGTEPRDLYENAYKVIGEICTKLDNTKITSTEDRKNVYEFIESYRKNLFNNTIAIMGRADNGQLAAFENAVKNGKTKKISDRQFLSEADLNRFNAIISDRNKELNIDPKQLQAEKISIVPTSYYASINEPEIVNAGENNNNNNIENNVNKKPGKGILGYFIDDETLKEAKKAGEHCPFILPGRLISLYNDLRMWYIAQEDSGTYEEAVKKLAEASPEEKRNIEKRFLDDIKAHPINGNTRIDQENIRYFARMHKRAIDKIAAIDFPTLNMKDNDSLIDLANEKGKLGDLSAMILDFAQNANSKTSYISKYNRSVYIDEIGDINEFNKMCYIAQNLSYFKSFAGVSHGPMSKYLPNLQKAVSKFCLEQLNSKFEGTKIGEIPIEELQEIENLNNLIRLNDNIPQNNAPSEEALLSYLEGKSDPPFSEEFLLQLDNNKNVLAEQLFKDKKNDMESDAKTKYRDKNIVYNLSYIKMPPKNTVDNAVNLIQDNDPDYNNIDEKMRHDTNIAFLEIFDIYTSDTSGQASLISAKDESAFDRFRINGKKVSEILSEKGYKLENDPDKFKTACQAELLKAYADKSKQVTFIPFELNKNGEIKEGNPLEIAKLKTFNNSVDMTNADKNGWSNNYTAKLYTVLRFLDTHNNVMGALDKNEPAYKTFGSFILMDHFNQGEAQEGELANYHDEKIYLFNSLMEFQGMNYDYIKGTKPDGTLTEDGKNHLNTVLEYLKDVKNKSFAHAESLNEKDPMLAELIRSSADIYNTEEGELYTDLYVNNNSFCLINSQNSILGFLKNWEKNPKNVNPNDFMKGFYDYPNEKHPYPLIEIFSDTNRINHAHLSHNKLSKNDAITQNEDRLLRKMLISELDSFERHLKTIDEFVLKSQVKGSAEEKKAKDLETHYIQNSIEHPSSYYPRGTLTCQLDAKGKRALLANGWPVKDINFLSNIFMIRGSLKDKLDKGIIKQDKTDNVKYQLKIMDQVCSELEKHPIKNANDRLQMLNMIKSYSADIYTKDSCSFETEIAKANFTELEKVIKRVPLQNEFLTENELNEEREAYNNYLNWEKEPDLERATANGPLSFEEKALINPVYITQIMEGFKALNSDAGFKLDNKNVTTLNSAKAYLDEIKRFYSDNTFNDPNNPEKRNEIINSIKDKTEALSNALAASLAGLEQKGNALSENEKKQLESLKMTAGVLKNINSEYTGRVNFEKLRRKEYIDKLINDKRHDEAWKTISEENLAESTQAASDLFSSFDELDIKAMLTAQNEKYKTAKAAYDKAHEDPNVDSKAAEKLRLNMVKENKRLDSMLRSVYSYYFNGKTDAQKIEFIENNDLNKRVEIVSDHTATLPEDIKVILKQTFDEMKNPDELSFEEQVTHNFNDQINRLKNDAANINMSEEERNNYLTALEEANKNLTQVKEDVHQYYTQDLYIKFEDLLNDKTNTLEKNLLEAEEDENFKLVVRDMDAPDFLETTPLAEQMEALDKVKALKTSVSKDHIDNVVEMLKKMDELQLSTDRTDSVNGNLAFSDLINAKKELEEAINSSNPDEIMQKNAVYNEKKRGVDDLMRIAEKFSQDSLTRNIGGLRQKNLPWEYAKNYTATSHINGIYKLYAFIKENGLKIEDFAKDPNEFYLKNYNEIIKKSHYKEIFKDKTPGEIAGLLNNNSDIVHKNHISDIAINENALVVAFEGVYKSDPNTQNRNENLYKHSILTKWEKGQTNFIVNSQNPFNDAERRKEVLQLLSIAVPGDLNADQIFERSSINEDGIHVKKITIDDYIKNKKFNYDAITNTGVNIITDALKVPGSTFDVAEFMENRQIALTRLLTANIKDQSMPGYDLLEDEILKTAELYESLRAVYPELKIPALTDEQKESFNKRAKDYTTLKKRALKSLTRTDKTKIEHRRNVSKQNSANHDRLFTERIRKSGEVFITQYNAALNEFSEFINDHPDKMLNGDNKNYNTERRKKEDKLIAISRKYKEWLVLKALNGEISEDYCKKRLNEIDKTDKRNELENIQQLKASKYKKFTVPEKTHLDRLTADQNRKLLEETGRVIPDPVKFIERIGISDTVDIKREAVTENINKFYRANEKAWNRSADNNNPALLEFWESTKDSADERIQNIHNALDKLRAIKDKLSEKTPAELEGLISKLKNVVNDQNNNDIENIDRLREAVGSLHQAAYDAISVKSVSLRQRFNTLGNILEEAKVPNPVYEREYNVIIQINDLQNAANEQNVNAAERLNPKKEELLQNYLNDSLTKSIRMICYEVVDARERADYIKTDNNATANKKTKASIRLLDATRRRDILLNAIKDSFNGDELSVHLKNDLGEQRSREILNKLGGRLNNFSDIDKLTDEERDLFIGVAVGNLSRERRLVIEDLDKKFIPAREMGFNRELPDVYDTTGNNKIFIDQLTNSEHHQTLTSLSDQTYFYWNKNKDGTPEEKTQYMADLKYADIMLCNVNKEAEDSLNAVNKINLDTQNEANEKLLNDAVFKQFPAYKGVGDKVPDAPGHNEAHTISFLSRIDLSFTDEHTDSISEMLDKMNKSGLLSENKGF
ncbi:MAG: hypothetical protein K6F99_06695, partial [Lachnospiraceae bacterium]|nr:hypothetical protein [Lachnospiraceae bacterium]